MVLGPMLVGPAWLIKLGVLCSGVQMFSQRLPELKITPRPGAFMCLSLSDGQLFALG
jgi:hypothetical protein